MKYAALLAAVLVACGTQAFAAPPTNQSVLRAAMLSVAYDDCIEAAAASAHGILSTHRKDWPAGYGDCAIIMRAEDAAQHHAQIVAWEHWYAKYAEQRLLIRRAARMLRANPKLRSHHASTHRCL